MNLKEIRARLEMTQAEFADSLGISLRALQSYEQGWRPVPKTVIRIITLTFQQAYNAPKCTTCNKGICTSGCANEDLNK